MDKITLSVPDNFSSSTKIIQGYVYDTLTSTNEQAWKLSCDRDSPFFVVAKEQTKGKGQRGKSWVSQPGGLYLSLCLDVDLAIASVHHLTLLSVCGIVSQLQEEGIPARIKWLNDLILAGQKLGGILCETKCEKNIVKQVVIGVGLNWQNSVPEGGISIANWLEKNSYSSEINQHKLLEIVVFGILTSYQQYQQKGIDFIVQNYNQLLCNLHQRVIIDNNQGIILGINQLGNLTVKLASGTASSYANFSFEEYRISYQKERDNCYLLTEK